jgi:hypothetical protein
VARAGPRTFASLMIDGQGDRLTLMQFSIRQPPVVIMRRLLLVWAACVLSFVLFGAYLLWVMEQGRIFLAASIVDPERLASFEAAAQSERLFTTTWMVLLYFLSLGPFAVALKLFKDMTQASRS